jgi:hypothetical protein
VILSELQAWLYTIEFGLIGCLIISINIWYLILSKIDDQSVSFILFIGGGFGALALFFSPIDSFLLCH